MGASSGGGRSSSLGIGEVDEFRIISLYEHTILMVELSDEDTLRRLGLNVGHLKRDSFLTLENKIDLMEGAFGLNFRNELNYSSKILILEDKMVKMMEDWNYEED